MPQLGKRLYVTLFGGTVQWHPQLVVSPQETLGYISGIHKDLPCSIPQQAIGTCRIYGILITGQCPLAQPVTLPALGSTIVRECQPWRNTGHQTTETFHINNLAVTIVETGAVLSEHILLEVTIRHILQHRLCHFVSQRRPVFTVGLLSLMLGQNTCWHKQQDQK